MNGGWIFLIVLIFLALGGFGGWVAWSRIRASRLGLPPPSLNPFARGSSSGTANYPAQPAPGGIRGFIDNQIHKFKNRNNRSATGAYEEPSSYSGVGRGRGAGHRLDPDEAWDVRVGNEVYYEEQELGLHAPQTNAGYTTPYGGQSTSGYPSEERGRSRTREYEEDSLHADARGNPFGDEHAASSLRGVSPRPLDTRVDTSYGGSHAHAKNGSVDNSPTESRRSAFRENM